ncbi:MAG: ribonuclease P protein component [Verrucomicrobiota bacterium]|nr:ribonuclease P protein component [Verrucomicrobiota bacterium]
MMTDEEGFVDCGLSREQRLLRSAVFRETFAQGNRRAGRFLVLWVRRAGDACLRLGVVASRRALPRAVDRARAKRLLREAYRLNRFRLEPGCDVVLVARRDILGAGRREVEKDLIETTRRAGILRIPA